MTMTCISLSKKSRLFSREGACHISMYNCMDNMALSPVCITIFTLNVHFIVHMYCQAQDHRLTLVEVEKSQRGP